MTEFGYPLPIFSVSPGGKHMCTSGRHVLKDPIQTGCGHRYCRHCFNVLTTSFTQTGPVYCKGCESEGYSDSVLLHNKIYPDRAILRELHQMTVSCIVQEECDWLGLLKEYDDHVTLCPHVTITCVNKIGCGASMKRSNLSEHLDKHCPMRITKCKYCTEQIPYREIKEHNRVCDNYPVKCEYCNQDTLSRKELKRHQDPENGDCSMKLVHCSFKTIGCDVLLPRGSVHDHDSEYIHMHQGMLLKTCLDLNNQFEDMALDRNSLQTTCQQQARTDKKIEQLFQSIKTMEESLCRFSTDRSSGAAFSIQQVDAAMTRYSKTAEELKNKNTVLENKLSTYEGIVAVLNSQIERDAQAVHTIEGQQKRDRDLIESLERKIKSQDRIIALKDVALAEQNLMIQTLELASYDGIMVWKIADFNRRCQEAVSGKTTSVYSQCFFTGRHGYKMCARVYLNGDGMGKGNHVSLFFVIMRGPNDAILRWPFRQKVTFMWLDQNNRDHVVDAFRPDPTSNSFQRPKNDMNIASGCPLFMPLSQLHSPRHAYVKDDVAFLKVIVDTTDLG
ncbi:TNF receptor-associated factor 2-like [Saccoglossus kowalevskii]|uniref:TNF receptor-associated factor 2-like n=1 Tax=Saccoglossus kowalevskii TaxID=10224 RepID=A0ABM0MWQ9_SACKO|nr:PREDICTED: TNF receptor-associated factor 2-like [Saccoglossus kowalevskii]